MKLLLINSASSDPFCGFYDGKDISVSHTSEFISENEKSSRQQDKLINCLQKISEMHRKDFQSIDAISVVTGPGSFTGIRVGIAMAKGISMALDKKIIPVTNFELTLNRMKEVKARSKYCVLIAGKLPEYYYGFMQEGKELSRGFVPISEISAILDRKTGQSPVSTNIPAGQSPFSTEIVGDFGEETGFQLRAFDVMNIGGQKTEVESMLELSLKYYGEGKLFPAEKIQPVYIKDFVVRK